MNEKHTFQLGKLFWAVAVFIGVLIFSVGIWLGTLWQNHSVALSPEQEKLAEIRSYIDEYYLFDTDAESQLTGLCKGLIDSLKDPYARYFTPEELTFFLDSSKGDLVGIGAQIQKSPKTQEICITYVLPDGPADRAGIKVNDILLFVGDMPTDELSITTISQSYVMGEEGTQVSLTIYRPSTDETLVLTITREKVTFPFVEYHMLENQTGYLTISEFPDYLPTEFISAIEDLENQGMKQLVLDLRNNPGGSLQSAVKVADYLLPDFFVSDQGERLRAPVVSLRDKHGITEQYECADGNSLDIPIVVLVNEYSASASEMLSGALRDYGQCALVGTNTFGKGISQSIIPLSDKSAVKLTDMQYFIPSGFSLHGVGLAPDVVVESSSNTPDYDNQLQVALQTLEEIQQGKRQLPILVRGKNELEPPKTLLEQAKQKPCKTKHFAFTRKEMENLFYQICEESDTQTLIRTDNWEFNNERGYERGVTFDFSSDGDMWIDFSFDAVTEELHKIELYLPTQKAITSTLAMLEAIDTSMNEADWSKLREKISAYPIEENKALTEILKKKNYSVYAGYDNDHLYVIIE